MALKGKNATVKIGVLQAGPFTNISEMKSVDSPFSASSIDTSIFGDSWTEKVQGLKDATYALEGFLDETDTNGQIAIRSSFLNDTPLYLEVNYGSVSTYVQQVLCTKFDINAIVTDAVTLKITLDGTAPATITP